MRGSPGFIWKTLAVASCVAFFLAPRCAQAHADAVSSSPAANATIASSPAEISIAFSQPVTAESTNAIVILRPNGSTVGCAGGARRDPGSDARIVCIPAETLGRGVYTVVWFVTSDDTHVVHGSFAFGIEVSVREAFGIRSYPYDPSGFLASSFRWLSLLGAALLTGTLAFSAFVFAEGTFSGDAGAAVAVLRRRSRRLWRLGLCAVFIGSVLALDVQTASATGSNALTAIPSVATVVLGSMWGLAWLARMCSLVGVGILTWHGNASAISLGLCALLLLSFSQSGHALTNQAAVATDWIHLTCASLWFGGLAVFGTSLRPAVAALVSGDARSAFTAAAISRFSSIAVPAVVALTASGVYASAIHSLTIPTILEGTYGRIVLAKVVLLIPLLVLGYRHYRSGRGGSSKGFALTVAAEGVLVVIIIALSAVLTGLPPPPPAGAHD